MRTADSSAIRIHVSTEVTDRKLYTLMHDTQYRAEVARQNTTYNQPSYTSFYLGSDIDWSNVPLYTTLATPADVAFVDRPGHKNDAFTVPAVDGVVYLFDGAVIAAGTHSVPKHAAVTVAAVPAEWYFFAVDAATEWEHVFKPGRNPQR